MAKYTYQISIVERGRTQEWLDFWMGGKPSPELRKANKNGSLGRTELVEAANLEEAIAIAKHRNPDCVVMRQGSSKLG